MKFLLLLFICLTTGLYAGAQSNDWFAGTWYGERTFPDSRISKLALLRMEIEEIKNDLFTGRLLFMYPGDTTTRLIRKIGGQLYGRYAIIDKSREIYRLEPREQGFWSDCSRCPGSSSFYIDNGDLVLQITRSSACGDSCNGRMTFRRKIEDYDTAMQATLIKKFGTGKPPAAVATATPANRRPQRNRLQERKDSLKIFPTMLNDSMRFSFDFSKYVLPNTTAMDTTLSAAQQTSLNKPAKQTTSLPKLTPAKDSMGVNKKKQDTASIASKTVQKNLPATTNKTLQPDTARLTAKAVNSTPANKLPPPASSTPKDTAATQTAPAKATPAALPAPVKDTVPAAIVQRTTNLVTTYEVSSPHIAVQLFDDGQIDGDAVSVYYNGKMIINNQTLTHKAITFTLEATATNRHHEFILISESEGFLSPNTALMRIKAGTQQFELTVNSSSASNAKIAIDYTGK